ncbi:MAG: DUF354 domain-containing protein [Verrucomicrobiota bacterium]
MFRNRLYYRFKPFVPSSVRRSVRRWFALRKREQVLDSWPILPGSQQPPENWLGWPEGKQFALVLTHDVESLEGLEKCRALMKVEMELGFRSTFNFIPEGPYSVSRELRNELTQNGFEVGVHDLHHDGKLYRNRPEFVKKAARINHYLKEWGASGFRSGFMLHNLNWLHELNIQYDASTFDTDPFEPQPHGRETIFPFWVPRPTAPLRPGERMAEGRATAASGYVELPYTLPQDSTLFVLFRERHPDIWFKKLDWVARHGGMALLDTHPDYMTMNGQNQKRFTYPVSYYEKFLHYVKQKYAGLYWHALSREVAELVRCRHSARLRPTVPLTTLNGHQPEQSSSEFTASTVNLSFSKSDNSKSTIWIDMDNTPHVVFFEPVIDELRSRGFPVVVTARDAFQVCELADKKKISFVQVGRHYGKNRFRKVAGVLYRALQLAPVARREKPILSISHGARSQIVISNLLRIPTLLLADYEFAVYPPLMRPTWEMVPSVIPDTALCCKPGNIRKYPGIKEDVYVWKFQPDPEFLQSIGLEESALIVTARPPATEAHYHNPESEGLFVSFMELACQNPQSRIVLLPRNKQQGETIRHRWPHWFANDKTIIPQGALDGLNLIWFSDLLVSGGGTMNREAAALGVPVYSIFRGAIGAVDNHLQQSGLLILIENAEDVAGKIKLQKRVRRPMGEATSRKSLDHIVNTIEELVHSISDKKQHR